MKRILAIVLSFIMIMACQTSVFAATWGGYTVSASKSEVKAGETVEFTISLNATEEAVMNVAFVLDIPTGLTFESATIAEAGKTEFDGLAFNKSNMKVWANGSAYGYTGGSVALVTVKCTVADNAEGTLTVGLKNASLTDGNYATQTPSVTSATVKIAAAPCKHTNTTAIGEAKPATCTETGLTAGIKCKDCGTILEAQKEIAKLAHTPETIPGKAATCTETGLTDGSKCSVCGTILTKQTEIAKSAHNYVDGKCTACGTADPNYGKEEPTPDKPADPTPTPDKGTTDKDDTTTDSTGSVNTGDNASIALWVIVMAAAAATVVVLKRKKIA